MLYQLYEINHAVLAPWRALAHNCERMWESPANPFGETWLGRSMAASLHMFERFTRRYGKPAFDITETMVDGIAVPVIERARFKMPFCTLLHFEKAVAPATPQKTLLIVAPMSGHYATLLRGTVETMLPHFDVYITDWQDARDVPSSEGPFDFDTYVDYLIDMLKVLGPGVNVMAVCQPSVPVMAAVSLMSAANDPSVPATMTLMGGPIDTRRNPTKVNLLAMEKGIDWFRSKVIIAVPAPNAGVGRAVYPGFLQLSGFMTMNLDRHMEAHQDLFRHLVEGDEDSAEKQTDFYDEYLSVMDLTAEFYLQTVQAVFIDHALPEGTLTHRGVLIEPAKITRTALLAVEGERDDISGVGQTEAALDLCSGIPQARKAYHLQMGVGHYGVFNGSKFRSDIAPRIRAFIEAHS